MRDMREALLRLQPATKPAPAPSTVTQPAPAPSTVKFGVDGTGAGRALSESASSSIASPAFLTHEFSEYADSSNLTRSGPHQRASPPDPPPHPIGAAGIAAPT